MRLLLAVLEPQHLPALQAAVSRAGFSATLIGSSGGFRRRGNVTLLLAVPAEQVDDALDVLRAAVGAPASGGGEAVRTHVFIVPVEQFGKF